MQVLVLFLWSISLALILYAVLFRRWAWLQVLIPVAGMLFIHAMTIYNLTLVPGWERPP